MDVADLLFQQFELVSRTNQVVKHVPNLSLVKVFTQVVSVLDFATEHKLKLRIHNLNSA